MTDEDLSALADEAGLTEEELQELLDDMEARGELVAGVAQLDMVTEALDRIETGKDSGAALDAAKEAAIAGLITAWLGSDEAPPWRVDTVFDTIAQTSYGAGRYGALMGEDMTDSHPVWEFDATLDSRTTDFCRTCDKTVLDASHPWWNGHYPPCHFGCRSIVQPTSGDAAKTFAPPGISSMEGFGDAPSGAPDWGPERGDYPKTLWTMFLDK